jgi:aspartate/methionine/tyrosine aminotransferase
MRETAPCCWRSCRAPASRRCFPPTVRFIYADVSRFTADCEAIAKAMLKEIGVAVTPGIDFDPARGANYLRLCYAGDETAMREAARRIAAWLKGSEAGARQLRSRL